VYYWTGNAAKARIMALVLADPRPKLVVFDYGAGRGGDWPVILEKHPHIELVCYEPDAGSAAVLRDRLKSTPARVLSDDELASDTVSADCIVSFSVLEHVCDKLAYMRHAQRHLAVDGTFYLNYDDGHFRTALDLDEFRGWGANLAVALQNRLAALWPHVNRTDRYQARISSAVMRDLVQASGFVVADDRYENLTAFKNLAKTIEHARQQEFTRFWLSVEDDLNNKFRTNGDDRMGDTVNLWREMASRSLALRHA